VKFAEAAKKTVYFSYYPDKVSNTLDRRKFWNEGVYRVVEIANQDILFYRWSIFYSPSVFPNYHSTSINAYSHIT